MPQPNGGTGDGDLDVENFQSMIDTFRVELNHTAASVCCRCFGPVNSTRACFPIAIPPRRCPAQTMTVIFVARRRNLRTTRFCLRRKVTTPLTNMPCTPK